ncbi:MAG: AIR synthase-related protein, partial [Pyrinomonadaceae bacterium]
CLEGAEEGLLQSAHDCSEGGLAVALAECCFSSLNRPGIGAEIELNELGPTDAALFGESPSRIVISFGESARGQVAEIAKRRNCPFTILGRVCGDRLRINSSGSELINTPVRLLENAWRDSLSKKLQAEAMAAGRE